MERAAPQPDASPAGKRDRYHELKRAATAILGDETEPLAWMATLSCLIRETMGFLWVGFYVVRDGELVVGPYQGSLGCLRISFNRGVCGACARRRETVIVPDVHAFAGHIACDSRSRSEIVSPVFDAHGQLRAVLDIDSDQLDSFDEEDRLHLEELLSGMRGLRWTPLS